MFSGFIVRTFKYKEIRNLTSLTTGKQLVNYWLKYDHFNVGILTFYYKYNRVINCKLFISEFSILFTLFHLIINVIPV